MNIKLLKKISETPAVSSLEYNINNLIIENLKGDFTIQKDGLNSLIVFKNNKSDDFKIMISAHSDEVGLMVKSIDKNGFIYMQNIGSLWSHLLAGFRMKLINKEGKVFKGVIGSPAIHGFKDRDRVIKIEDLYLDLGVSSDIEIKKLGIDIGDMIVFDSEFIPLNEEGYFLGKAIDNRINNFILLEVLNSKLNKNFYGVFSSQEEVGLRGIRGATNIIKPDIAINLDTTLSSDTPFNKGATRLNNGVVLSLIDSNSLAPRKLIRYLEKLCKLHNIKYQYAVFNGGGTDSGNIHKSLNGIINMTLSIPVRYMHTSSTVFHINDVLECIKLLKIIINDINKDKLKELL